MSKTTCCRKDICLQCCFFLVDSVCPNCRQTPLSIKVNEQVIEIAKPGSYQISNVQVNGSTVLYYHNGNLTSQYEAGNIQGEIVSDNTNQINTNNINSSYYQYTNINTNINSQYYNSYSNYIGYGSNNGVDEVD